LISHHIALILGSIENKVGASSMKKVYQVVGGYDYEGHDAAGQDVKVFSTEKKALAYKELLESQKDKNYFDYVEVFEFLVE
jgi:hypothetical protein